MDSKNIGAYTTEVFEEELHVSIKTGVASFIIGCIFALPGILCACVFATADTFSPAARIFGTCGFLFVFFMGLVIALGSKTLVADRNTRKIQKSVYLGPFLWKTRQMSLPPEASLSIEKRWYRGDDSDGQNFYYVAFPQGERDFTLVRSEDFDIVYRVAWIISHFLKITLRDTTVSPTSELKPHLFETKKDKGQRTSPSANSTTLDLGTIKAGYIAHFIITSIFVSVAILFFTIFELVYASTIGCPFIFADIRDLSAALKVPVHVFVCLPFLLPFLIALKKLLEGSTHQTIAFRNGILSYKKQKRFSTQTREVALDSIKDVSLVNKSTLRLAGSFGVLLIPVQPEEYEAEAIIQELRRRITA